MNMFALYKVQGNTNMFNASSLKKDQVLGGLASGV